MAVQNHNDIAARFMDMCDTFNRLAPSYVRVVPLNQPQNNYPPTVPNQPYIITHLTHWVAGYVVQSNTLTRSGNLHVQTSKVGSDNRRTIPSTIRKAIAQLPNPRWQAEKAEVKWVVCWLNGILPDTNAQGWQQFECSHKCIEFGLTNTCCIDVGCLCWESKSTNQSRGNRFCMLQCTHCLQPLCHCQHLHNPPCE
jgi:hypothetical protein